MQKKGPNLERTTLKKPSENNCTSENHCDKYIETTFGSEQHYFLAAGLEESQENCTIS